MTTPDIQDLESGYPESFGTGSQEEGKNAGSKTIDYPFDRYIVRVRLTQDNEFIGIAEIEVRQDFMSHKQKACLEGFHDVDRFYKD